MLRVPADAAGLLESSESQEKRKVAMPDVRGCHLPDDLLYDVENHIWFKELDDGNLKLGMTTVATAMAGQLVAFTPKKAGRAVQARLSR